ncbi:MAG: hypothetical protein WCJ64_00285 [Rhodospirillaceae bacterium]
MLVLCIESGHARGMGHLFRAMTLADALIARGHEVLFLVNDDDVSLAILRERGHRTRVVELSEERSDWETAIIRQTGARVWINDRLDTGAGHAGRIKAAGLPLVTFDDRGSGARLADLHVAALAFEDTSELGGRCVLHGVEALVLNPEIAHHRRPRQQLGSLLVSLGGSDTWGATVTVVRLLAERGRGGTVVIGPSFGHHRELEAVLTPAFTLKRGVPSLIEEMSRHDLAVTGGGITPFEANAAGLPCIVVANESFEIPVARALERLGGAVFAGHHIAIDAAVFDRPLPIEAMSRRALAAVTLDGTRRVVEAIERLVPA